MKIGFIVEGYTERIILRSDNFQALLKVNELELVYEIIVAGSKDNLTQDKIGLNVQILRENGAEVILVLRDLDDCLNVAEARSKIITNSDIEKVISVQAIEAWFLADSITLSSMLSVNNFYFEKPEEEIQPFDKLRELRIKHAGRGIGDKKVFARIMVSNGFSIENAAAHPNCPSALYFLNKLKQIAVN